MHDDSRDPLFLTDAAKALLQRYFSQHPLAGIRLEHAEGGCAGPRLQLRLDEALDVDGSPPGLNDICLERGGFVFVADAALLQAAMPVTIDATRLTFVIRSGLQLEAGGCKSCKGCS